MLESVRGKIDGLLIEQFFRTLSRVGRLHPRARLDRHGVEAIRDIPYHDTGRVEHRLDVYRPIKRDGLLPVVLYAHGGAFCILSKDTHWLMALAFARRGFVVFNINYRLAPQNKFPAAIEDTCRAFSWLARNAELWGGDPERIFLAGESAGANLVTSLAVATSWERPEPWARAAFDAGIRPVGVLPACGNLQVSDSGRYAQSGKYPRWVTRHIEGVEKAYLGGVQPAHDRFFDLADPILSLERAEAPARPLPRFFAACGTKDVLLDDSRRLKVAVERLGGTCRLAVFPGEVHAFHAFVWRQSARDYWQQCHAFLGECVTNGRRGGGGAERPPRSGDAVALSPSSSRT